MRVLASLVLGFFLLGSSVSSASAEMSWYSIGDLLRSCKDYDSRDPKIFVDAGFCVGYMQGADDMIDALVTLYDVEPLYCLPSGVTLNQRIRVFIKNVEDHPASHHLPMILGYANSISTAFPCPAK